MPVTEVQWIGASCGRHSSYTFYRGFRLIADGVEKKFCLGEFYFVRNSTNQPICIAELQLVWHDASTDNQLASARLYFRPEDTPIGRLPNHGQDELLYADQKVVIKCHDMARWQDSGVQWNSGMIPLYESDFICINDKYYLDSHYVDKEREIQLKASESWKSGDQPRSLHILTFPAYCRYRALKKRLLAGACLAKAQLVALGGVLGNQTSQRVLFCRDSFHHPLLDKFELAGDNKAPVLKGRPRKKKNLHAAQNSVLKKKRLVAETQNHATNAPAAKRCKISEQEEAARSDMSERVLERIKVPPVSPRAVQNNVPAPLVKPKVQVTSDVSKAVVSNAPLTNTKAPPPLIPADRLKGVAVTTKLSHEQADMKVNECSRTTPMQRQIYPTDAKLKKTDQLNNNNKINSALLVKPHLSDSVKPSLTSNSLTSVSSSSEIKTGSIINSSARDNHGSTQAPTKSVTNTSSAEQLRTRIPGVQTEALSSSSSATRPVASTQGTVGTQLAVSVSPAVRTQPVASLPQTVSSAHTIGSKTYQHVEPLAESVSTSGKPNDGLGTGAVRARDSKENDGQQFRLATEGKREYGKSQTEEAVAWKKKMKRLRMPGNVKDEEYEDEDEKYFMQTLRDFMRKNDQPLGKLPALGFKKVNLWTMYNTAQRFGGYDAVTSKRLWRRVYDSLGGSATITSAATYTRRHYERLLLPYERHIRSQLKKQIDEKKPTPVKKPAAKEAPNKVEKKEGLTVSANSTRKPNLYPNTDKAATVKQTEGGNLAKIQRSNAVVSSPPESHVKVSAPSDAKETTVKTTDSVYPVLAVTTSVTSKPHEVPISSIKHQEPTTTRNDEVKVTASQPLALRTSKRDVIPSEQFQAASDQQVSNYQVKMTSNNEEACARTNTIYTKNAAAVAGNSDQPHHGAALQRVAHDGTPLSSQPKKIITPGRGREIIDLTSEDSPLHPQACSQSLSHVQPLQANPVEKPQVSRLVSERDTDGGRRHTSKSHLRKEFNDGGLRYQLNSDVQCSREMSPVCDKLVYSSKSQVKPKIPTSSSVTWVDSMERRYAHSPSSDSVDEHFAEWRRRQTNIPAQNVSHQRELGNPERMLRYNYIKDEICPPDCSCLLSASRKNDISSLPPPPKPKKEHYEEDVPFPGMTLYPGRWSPTMIAADHPDLYFSSHPPHLPSPQDTLASHMCTASRIFIPTAPIFSPPYHLGLPPMGGASLITGTDDQLHIHPHLLMGSPYPCTSNARTPDGTPYLYSYT